ncbi:MAG: lysophospholipase [Anaerolineales bacterium]|nr:lysophospholipase [Anaerolineales bacterium]
MIHDESTFKAVDGLELFYQSWKPEKGKAAVAIVHGFGEHSGRYSNVVEHLVGKGYDVHAFDLRGHGRSPGKRGHINAWSEYRNDVKSFVEMLAAQKPGQPLFLMGHSLGGLVVLEHLLRSPDGLQGVIASGPTVAQTGVSPLIVALSSILSRIVPAMTINTGLDATAVSRDPEVVEAYRSDPLVHSFGSPRLGAEMQKAMAWTMQHAKEWKTPLLVLYGSADRLVPPEAVRAFYKQVPIADKERIEYEGGFHEPHNDIIHQQVTADLERWLSQHLD